MAPHAAIDGMFIGIDEPTHSLRMGRVSTPERTRIGSPEQKYINEAGRRPPNWGPFH
jgi:hypothetical protein